MTQMNTDFKLINLAHETHERARKKMTLFRDFSCISWARFL